MEMGYILNNVNFKNKIYMANKKNDKKPIVNWFSRKKEVEFSTKKVGDKDKNVKTKVVKAPDSMLSKGFEKKVVRTSTPVSLAKENKRMKRGMLGAMSAITLGPAAIMLNNRMGAKKEEKNIRNINNTVDYHNRPSTASFDTKEEMDKHIKEKYAKREKDIGSAYSKLNKDRKRSENISKGILSAIPLTLAASVALGSKKNEGKSTKVVTKTKNDRKK
jgi:hypothetical protein